MPQETDLNGNGAPEKEKENFADGAEKTAETAKTASDKAGKEAKPKPRQSKDKTGKAAEIEALRKQLAEANDRLMRTAAEYENYRKRTERERLSSLEYGKAQMIKPLLPIFDGIERADACDPGSSDYLKGVEMIIKQFRDLKRVLGIEEIGKVGEQFDPAVHEAVMHIEDDELGKNCVAQVLQKGYKYGDTVIRTAMVQVAN